jgi:hypothetical protein
MARPGSTRSWPSLAWPGWPSRAEAAPAPPAGWSSAGVASVGWSSGAPAARAGSAAQKPLRLGPHPDGRPPGRPHLVRPRRVRPQPGQDRRAAPGQAPQGSLSTPSQLKRPRHPKPEVDRHHQNSSSGPNNLADPADRRAAHGGLGTECLGQARLDVARAEPADKPGDHQGFKRVGPGNVGI